MTWKKEYINIRQYEWASVNQHGDRYKRVDKRQLSVAEISCKTDDAAGIQKLVLLSDTLDVPIRYDFEENMAYMRVVSHEALKGCI